MFLVRPTDMPNLNQMIESVLRDGYAIAQEYLPQARFGDLRVFMMNGKLLRRGNKIAAVRRIPGEGDMRSNITAGGTAQTEEVGDEVFNIAELLRPRLVADGLFLVGLDVVGAKLMEVNVFSPGNLNTSGLLAGVDFLPEVIAAIERKVEYVIRDRLEVRRGILGMSLPFGKAWHAMTVHAVFGDDRPGGIGIRGPRERAGGEHDGG